MARTPMKDMSVYYEDLEGLLIRDRYTLERFIKAGGSSGVYLAHDSVMNRQVAVKVMPPTDDVMGSRFEREAQGLSLLSHPNTVSVYDFGMTPDGYRYMILEYLEGRTLKEVMTSERWMAPGRAVHIFSQICRALRDAHTKGIVHRDIKPSNIFLIHCDGDDDFVKVLDFGVAKMMTDRGPEQPADITQIGRIIGTPRYMPPEQITSQDVDPRADVYTVGVVLYEMLCGSVPFVDTSLGGLLMLHLKEPPPAFETHKSPFLNQTPAGIEASVQRALEKQPEDRFGSIEDFRLAVETALEDGMEDATSIVPSPGYILPPLPGGRGTGIRPGDLVVEAELEEDDELEPISLDPDSIIEEGHEGQPSVAAENTAKSPPGWLFPVIGAGVVLAVVAWFAVGGGDEPVTPESVAPQKVEMKKVPSEPKAVEHQQDTGPANTPGDRAGSEGTVQEQAKPESPLPEKPVEKAKESSGEEVSPEAEQDVEPRQTETVPKAEEGETQGEQQKGPEGDKTVQEKPKAKPKSVVKEKKEDDVNKGSSKKRESEQKTVPVDDPPNPGSQVIKKPKKPTPVKPKPKPVVKPKPVQSKPKPAPKPPPSNQPSVELLD